MDNYSKKINFVFPLWISLYAKKNFYYIIVSMKEKIKAIGLRIFNDIKDYWIAVLAYLVYRFTTIYFFGSACPFVLIFGVPCPGCGITRSMKYLLTFRFQDAITINAMGVLWLAFLIWLIITRYLIGKRYKITDYILIGILVITVAYFIYMMINYYPNRIPYVHTRRNLTYYLITHQ